MKYVPPLGASDPNASYVQGNPVAGIRGSFPIAPAFEAMMREIVNAETAYGVIPDSTIFDQLASAIRRGDRVCATIDQPTSTGAAYVLLRTPSLAANVKLAPYQILETFIFVPANDSLAGATVSVDGQSVVPVLRPDGTAIQDGDIRHSRLTQLTYFGNAMRVHSLSSSSTTPQSGEGVKFNGTTGSLDFLDLTPLTTIAPTDLFCVYQSVNEAGLPLGHHRKMPWSALAAIIGGVTGTPPSGGVTGSGSGIIGLKLFSASGTYTPSNGATKALVIATGGGGAGGSSQTASLPGSGGAGANTVWSLLDLVALASASFPVTIGAGGAPSPRAAVVGSQSGPGGVTSLGTQVVAAGGPGGINSSVYLGSTSPTFGGNTGLVVMRGGLGQGPVGLLLYNRGGDGGGTFFGPTGGQGGALNNSADGHDGVSYGTGGGGSIGDGLGGYGANGALLILEF